MVDKVTPSRALIAVSLLLLLVMVGVVIWWSRVPPLERAAYNGELANLEALLNEGWDPNHTSYNIMTKEHRLTPITWAIKGQQPDSIRILIEHGALVEHQSFKYLYLSLIHGCMDCAEVLLKNRADPNAATQEGSKVLSFAIERGDDQFASLLIQYGAHYK